MAGIASLPDFIGRAPIDLAPFGTVDHSFECGGQIGRQIDGVEFIRVFRFTRLRTGLGWPTSASSTSGVIKVA